MAVISIIIPVFQAEKYLRRTIESVQSQTFKDWELILVDDGSTDQSGKMCEDFSLNDCRIKVIHKENGGQSDARNAGLEAARGQYIYMMDNDDILLPVALECLMNNMKEGIDIAACSYIVVDENGNRSHDKHTKEVSCYDNDKGMKELLLRNLDIYIWTKLYRKSFLEKHKIRFEKNHNDEDFLFNVWAYSKAVRTVYWDIPIYHYYTRTGSTCHQLPQKNIMKYLSDTCYRIDKVEDIISSEYPVYLPLAKRQTIFYVFIMLGRIAESGISYRESNYPQIMSRLYRNRKQVIQEHAYWSMSLLGTILSLCLPARLYYYYRKYR